MLEVQNKPCVTVVAGVSGSGKSTFSLRYLVNAPLDVRFVFDPEEEYAQRLKLEPARDAYHLAMHLCGGWVLFDPHTLFPGRLDEAFAFFCEWAFTASERLPGRKLIVVDEAWKYVNARRHPVELEACVRSGRKRGLECLFNTQTPDQLHATIRNEATELVCFSLQEERCLEFPRSKGMDPDEIRALPDLHYVARNIRTRGELRGKIRL